MTQVRRRRPRHVLAVRISPIQARIQWKLPRELAGQYLRREVDYRALPGQMEEAALVGYRVDGDPPRLYFTLRADVESPTKSFLLLEKTGATLIMKM